MNLAKTKSMWNEYSLSLVIRINKAEIEDYFYLRGRFESNSLANGKWTRRRRAGWVAFSNNRRILTDQTLAVNIRATILDSTILPAMLYVYETWATTKSDEEKFAVTERAMEGTICRVTIRDRISKEELLYVRDMVGEIYATKRRWTGRVAQQLDNRWTSRLTTWIPRNRKRLLGWPETRCD